MGVQTKCVRQAEVNRPPGKTTLKLIQNELSVIMHLAQQRAQPWTPLKITRLMKLRDHLKGEELIDQLSDK
jgi:hypothetical protein